MKHKIINLALLLVLSTLTNNMLIPCALSYVIESSDPPKLAYDTIHCPDRYNSKVHVLDIAKALGFDIKEITGNTIVESDLLEVDTLLLYGPSRPYLTQTEIDLILDFLNEGKALYVVPFVNSLDSYWNVLYELFGFKISGVVKYLDYPDIKNVSFTHPIMDGVRHIYASTYVVTLDLVSNPAWAILSSEGYPLFLVSTYGKGRIFIDLLRWGINSEDRYDDSRVVRNALIWLKGIASESFQIFAEGNFFSIVVLTNSIISSFEFEKEKKMISFSLTGLLGTEGSCNISIPKGLMWCDNVTDWNLTVDDGSPKFYSLSENNTRTFLFFKYDHSTHKVQIASKYVIPEFQLALILPLLVIVTLVAVVLRKTIWTERGKE